MSPAPAADAILTVADIAAQRECSRWTALRWLKSIREKHGDRVVWEERGKLVTTARALSGVAEPSTEEKLRQALNRIALLESVYKDQDLRINGISRDLVDLRAREREWHGAASQVRKSVAGVPRVPRSRAGA